MSVVCNLIIIRVRIIISFVVVFIDVVGFYRHPRTGNPLGENCSVVAGLAMAISVVLARHCACAGMPIQHVLRCWFYNCSVSYLNVSLDYLLQSMLCPLLRDNPLFKFMIQS